MEGGVIYNNMASHAGGGVRVGDGIFEKPGDEKGGEIYGNIAKNGTQVNADGDKNQGYPEKKRDYNVLPTTTIIYNKTTDSFLGFD